MPNSNSRLTFLLAEAYLAMGYVPIPLWGDADPDRAKVAAIAWGSYQRRRPSAADLRAWFGDGGHRALGLVCGSISRLAVLDFDDERRYEDFADQHPHLAALHVLKTRRGYHIYFHVPPHLTLQSRKLPGLELLWEGRYVVARPSVINGHEYKLIKGGQPRLLDAADIQTINAYFAAAALEGRGGARRDGDAQPVMVQAIRDWKIREGDLAGLYAALVQRTGSRNEALFQTGIQARDSGVGQDEAIAALVERHVRTLKPGATVQETPPQRRREALATLASAYSRPPRPSGGLIFRHRFMPNSVREVCDQQGNTALVRVYNALRLEGIMPGRTFTRAQVLRITEGVIGRDSVDKALRSRAPNGQRVFAAAVFPPGPPLAPVGAAAAVHATPENPSCVLDRVQKPGKNQSRKSGRRPTLFVLPGNSDLCQMFGVPLTGGDPVTWDDLGSAKKTRQASLRGLLARRPGKYPRRWLAQRLGVCVRTLHAYLKALKIQVTATFHTWPITWDTLNAIPDDLEIMGSFLEDPHGRRYPPIRALAARLLAQGRAIVYKRQDVNDYRLAQAAPPPEPARQVIRNYREVPAPTHLRRETPPAATASPAAPNAPPAAAGQGGQNRQMALPGIAPFRPAPPETPQPARVSKRRYRRPLPDAAQEALAQRIYNTLNAKVTDAAQRISLVNARRCADTYSRSLIERALRLLERRSSIARPVGFFVTFLRSEQKAAHVG